MPGRIFYLIPFFFFLNHLLIIFQPYFFKQSNISQAFNFHTLWKGIYLQNNVRIYCSFPPKFGSPYLIIISICLIKQPFLHSLNNSNWNSCKFIISNCLGKRKVLQSRNEWFCNICIKNPATDVNMKCIRIM